MLRNIFLAAYLTKFVPGIYKRLAIALTFTFDKDIRLGINSFLACQFMLKTFLSNKKKVRPIYFLFILIVLNRKLLKFLTRNKKDLLNKF